jgi:hypothetical protein
MPARRYFGIQIELDSDAATDQLKDSSLPELKLFRDNRTIERDFNQLAPPISESSVIQRDQD